MLNASMARGFRGFFSRVTVLFTGRLRDQIVIPYLLLATALAVTGTYLLVNAANQSLHERFNRQLLDAAQGSADSIAQMEMQQLAGLRAIMYTQGFSEALMQGDTQTLGTLIAPQALNYGFDRVIVIAECGVPFAALKGKLLADCESESRILLDLPAATAETGTPSPELTTLIEHVLSNSQSEDKASAIAATSHGRVFFTAGPVVQGDDVIGAVLVGAELPQVLRLVARDSLSDGIGFYGPKGATLGHAIVATNTTTLPPALPAGWYEDVQADPKAQVRFRTVEIGGKVYVESLGPVPGRSPAGASPGVFGSMLATETLDAKLRETLWALLPVFGLGLLLIVLLGRILAAWIDKPLSQLVAASNHVAQGNLEVQVQVGRRDEIGVLAMRFNGMVDGLRQLIVVKDLFGRFVSPEVSEQLMSGQIELGGEQRIVTILFSDLREFTRLSEEHSAPEIVDLLNEYFRAIVDAARRHGGMVNKFGGDSTLIVFGAPLQMSDHADRALATAIEMRASLEKLNARRTRQGWMPLSQGIGMDTGMVVAGQIGSEDRMEYTVIGDAVNLSSRLQYLTKTLDCDIIFSESTQRALTRPDEFRYKDRGRMEVRGKQQGVKIYSLLGAGTAPSNGRSGKPGKPKQEAEAGSAETLAETLAATR